MGVAVFPIFERPIPGFDDPSADFGGKPLSAALESLDAISEGLGVPKLSDFVSMNREAAGFAEESIEEEELGEIPEDWTSPTVGLATVRGLIGRLREEPASLRVRRRSTFTAEEVLNDLTVLESMLQSAEAASARFHLSFDY